MTKTIRPNVEIERGIKEVMELNPRLEKESEVIRSCFHSCALDIQSQQKTIDWTKVALYDFGDRGKKLNIPGTRTVSVEEEDYQIILEHYRKQPGVQRVPFAYLTRLVLLYTRKKLRDIKNSTVVQNEKISELSEMQQISGISLIRKITELLEADTEEAKAKIVEIKKIVDKEQRSDICDSIEVKKEDLIKDIKEKIKFSDESGEPIDLIMNFFEDKTISDLEKSDFVEFEYKKLGWDKCKEFDVINSFWQTFSFAMHSKYPELYSVAEAGNVKIYKSSFPEKYLTKKSDEKEQVNELCKEYPEIRKLAKFCHCIANFMPCPPSDEGSKTFNQVKGILKETRDYLPMFIDKIQQCCENREPIKYKEKGIEGEIEFNIVKEWHDWLCRNQKRFHLEDYYSVSGNKIRGIPLFKGQKLSHPAPVTGEEMCECLENIIGRINKRAERLYCDNICHKEFR